MKKGKLFPFQKDMTVEIFNDDTLVTDKDMESLKEKEWDWSWGNAMFWAENQGKKND